MLLVQCDFDDTISVGNVSTALRHAFARDDWRSMEKEYSAGKYSVEESNIRQFALVGANREEIAEFVATQVVVRDGFKEFVDHCRDAGIRLVVVSSGLDLYIKPTMRRLGLPDLQVFSATARFTASGIEVEYSDPSGRELTRGFKESFLRRFKSSGHTVVYVGDGLSDVVPAGEAHFVIARAYLERHLRETGRHCYGFETFADVWRHVEEIQRLTGG